MTSIYRACTWLLFLTMIIQPVTSLAQAQFTIPATANLAQTSNQFGDLCPQGVYDAGSFFGCLYRVMLWTVGLAAFGAIVYGGILYVSAAQNPSRVGTAKEVIWNGILGIVLAGISWLILNTINPDLVKSFNLRLPPPL